MDDELTNERASIEYWKAKLMQEEYSEGEPVEPVPEIPVPSPVERRIPPAGSPPATVPVNYLFWWGVGFLLIGYALGRWIAEQTMEDN